MFLKKLLIIKFIFALVFSAPAVLAAPLTFNIDGVISDSAGTPLEAANVFFRVEVTNPTETCVLYSEDFTVDMTGSKGYFSIAVGSTANTVAGGYTLDKVFANNGSAITGSGTCPYTPGSTTETRKVKVSFYQNGAWQNFTSQEIQSVPFALEAVQSSKVGGYASSELLKADPSVSQATYPNSALTQAQYEQFWKLILGDASGLTTNVTAGNFTGSLAGDVSGTQGATVVDKIKSKPVDLTGAADGMVLKYQSGSFVLASDNAGSGGIASINGLTSTAQTFAVGSSGTAPAISSTTNTHTLNIPQASASASVTAGLISNADYLAFNAKQSNALPSAQVWVGNASGSAQARTLSGDLTIDNTGAVTVSKTQTAGANTILQLDASSVAITKGVDVKGAGSGSLQIRYPNTGTNNVLTFPSTAPAANQILQSDASGNLSWINTPTGSGLSALADGKMWVGNASGGPSEVAVSGDATISNAGVLTLKNTGTVGTYSKVITDAQGRVTSGSALASADITAALNYTPLNKAGDTMTGALAMGGQDITNSGNITMAANKYFTLSSNSTNGTIAGQMWYDAGSIKYYNGSAVQTLGTSGGGITSLNGLTAASQTFGIGVGGNAPSFSSTTNAHILNIPLASSAGTVSAGLISNSDYVSFSNKQSSTLGSSQIWIGNTSGLAEPHSLSGDVTISNVGLVTANKTTTAEANKLLSLDGSSIGKMGGLALINTGTVTLSAQTASNTYGIKFPAAAPAANQILQSDNLGNLSWINTPTGSGLSALADGKMWVGNASGGPSEVAISGDATISNAGVLTLKNTGTVGTYSKVITDAQGRVTSGSSLAFGDVVSALGFTPLSKYGDTMTGALSMGTQDITNTGNIIMASGKYLTLSGNTVSGTIAGQMWFDTGSIKYFDGASVQTLGSGGSPPSLADGYMWIGNGSGFPQAVALTGDVTISNLGVTSLKNTGTVGTYSKVVTDAQGRVTSGSSLASADITSALGYTPLNKTGDSMSGSLSMTGNSITNVSNINMLSNGYFLLSNNSAAAPTTAGQMWFDGYNIQYYDGGTIKTLGTAGSGISSLNGLTVSNQSFAVGIGGTTPAFTSAAGTHTLDIPMASASGTVTAGLISNTDYVNFSNKLSSALGSSQIWIGNTSGLAEPHSLSGDVTMSNVGLVTVNKTTMGEANKLLSLDGSSVGTMSGVALINTGTVTLSAATTSSTYGLRFPAAAPTADKILKSNGSGDLSWVPYLGAVSDSASLTNGKMWLGNASGIASEVMMSGDATISNAGVLTLKNTGTIGTYYKVITDAQGRVTSGSNLASSDITTALGYTPLNKAGDTMSGALAMGGQDITNTGHITMANGKYLGLSYITGIHTPSAGGQMWFDGTNIKFYNGTATQTLGVTGSGWVAGGNSFGTTPATLGTNDSYNLNFETNNITRMTVRSTGEIGIGTTSPITKFHILGTSSQPTLTGEVVRVDVDGTNLLTFGTNATERASWIRALSTTSGENNLLLQPTGGDVGIGTTGTYGPKARLHVYRRTPPGTIQISNVSTTVNGTGTDFMGDFVPGDTLVANGEYKKIVSITSNTVMNVDSSFTSSLSGISYAGLGAIIEGGNVGIGTTTPSSLLHVMGTGGVAALQKAQSTGAGSAAYQMITNQAGANTIFGSNTSSGMSVFTNGISSSSFFGASGSNSLQLITSNTARVTIDSSGNVGIGTTAPTNKLEVAGTTKLGASGTAFTAMGTCTFSGGVTTAESFVTCTGVPGSVNIAVSCSPTSPLSGATGVVFRATGTADQIALRGTASTTGTPTWVCMWMQP